MLSKSINTLKRAAFILPFTALLISNVALAHDEFKSQAKEGFTTDNAVAINHGCELTASGIPAPVIAQSVVFPGDGAVLTASDGNPIALSDVIEQSEIAGLLDLIQNNNIFSVQKEKHDAVSGGATGFYGKTGTLSAELLGRVPFAFTAPNFVSTSCVKKLNIEVAIADICVISKPTINKAKVNLWIPNNGSQYALKGAAAGVDGVGEPVVLQVNRNLAVNPLAAACGAGIDVTVTPSTADVDAHLGIPGYWSK
jgi:hypothetical protein